MEHSELLSVISSQLSDLKSSVDKLQSSVDEFNEEKRVIYRKILRIEEQTLLTKVSVNALETALPYSIERAIALQSLDVANVYEQIRKEQTLNLEREND